MSEQDDSADIIARIYDVAVDPMRYEEMLDLWERRLSTVRLQADDGIVLPPGGEPGIEAHLDRADVFIQRLLDQQPDAGRSPLDLDVKATFVVDRHLAVHSINDAARTALSLRKGDRLDRLPLSAEDAAGLSAAIRKQAGGRTSEPALLRFVSDRNERSILFHVARQAATPAHEPLVTVRTTELAWPPHLSGAIRDAFGLTTAEVEVVRALTEGRSLREIAEARGRSLATVRTQVAAILSKTETHSQSELIRLTLGLMDVVGTVPTRDDDQLDPAKLAPIPFSSRTTADGRRYDWIEFGDPHGRPCLFLPFDYGMIRWPRPAEIEAARRGIRVIVPVRAGYGHSEPQPAKVANYTVSTAADLDGLLGHLGIERIAVASMGTDLRFALALAIRAPGRVSGVVGFAGGLPVMNARQYERMGKWYRFILANARYAPRILPFLVRSGFALARAIGNEKFFRAVNGDSPGDMRTFADPDVKAAILMGSEVCLGPWHSAHEAFARECIDSETNWAHLIRDCPARVRLLQGAEDPQTPAETVRELVAEFPMLDVTIIDGIGQLVFFADWRRGMDEIEAMMA